MSFLKAKNKQLWSWCLYDFANQPFATVIITFIYSSFFTKVIANNEVVGIKLWTNGIAITAIIVSLVSPLIGAVADVKNLRKFFFISSTCICCLFTIALYFPESGDIYFAITLFVIANIFYEIACVFYNSFLLDISNINNRGSISGFAWGFGFIGGLISLFIALFFFNVDDSEEIRKVTVLVGIWMFFFSIPSFFFLKNNIKISIKNNKLNVFKSFIKTFKSLSKHRLTRDFLIARIFYNDGLITIFSLGGIYAVGVLNFSFKEVLILGIVLNISAAIGSFVFGYIEDKIGVLRVINITLIVLIIATFLAYLAPNTIYSKPLFWFSGFLIGLMIGPNQSCSRSLMGTLTPKKHKSEFFGFFALTGKATSFLGPFLYGIISSLYGQQEALWVVISLFILGFIFFNKIEFNSLNSRNET